MSGVFAGERILASQIQAIQAIYARKTANQSIASSTVLTNDTQLVIAVNANTSYSYALDLFYNGAATNTGDIKFGFTLPAGATLVGANLTITIPLGVGMGYYTQSTGQPIVSGSNGTGSPFGVKAWGTISIGATAGNFQLQWAQNTSNVTATTVMIGSSMNLIVNT